MGYSATFAQAHAGIDMQRKGWTEQRQCGKARAMRVAIAAFADGALDKNGYDTAAEECSGGCYSHAPTRMVGFALVHHGGHCVGCHTED